MPSYAIEIAKALGLNPTAQTALRDFDDACSAIQTLLKDNEGMRFPKGENKFLVNWSNKLMERYGDLRNRLAKAVKEGEQTLYRDGAVLADQFMKQDEVTKAKAAYERLVTTELQKLTEAVQNERSAKAQAIAMVDRAAWLLTERERLDPGADVLESAGESQTKARAYLAELDYNRALTEASKAVTALEKVPDPVRDLKDTDGKPELVAQVKTLRRTVLSSPLDELAKSNVLDFILTAVEEIKKPNNEQKATEAITEADAAYRIAMSNLATDRAKFLGLLDTGKGLINKLATVGDHAKVLELRVQLDGFLGRSLNPTAQEVTDLTKLVATMQAAHDKAIAAYEAVAANLKKLEGFEPDVNKLIEQAKELHKTVPFDFPVDPQELLSDFRALTDKVHNRTARATEVETVVQELLDHKAEDTSALTEFLKLRTDIGKEDLKVAKEVQTVERSLKTVKTLLGGKGVEIGESSSPRAGSIQDYERKLKVLLEGWRSTKANCWKSRSIDSSTTVQGLILLNTALEQLNPDSVALETKIATARAAYRKAHEEAMKQVSAAVLVQRVDDKQPANALGAITKLEQRFHATDDVEEIVSLTEGIGKQTDLLRRYITSQEEKVMTLRTALEKKLDDAGDLLAAVLKAKKGGKSKKSRKAEQKYAQFLVDQQIPELALFVESTLFSVLDGALERADKLLRDARSIHAVIVDGGSASYHRGVTFDTVTQKIDEVKRLLKNKHLGTHRKAARAKFLETLNDINDRAFSRPTAETIGELDSLLDPADGIPKAVNEAVLDGKNKAKFKKAAKDLRAKLKKKKKAFTAKFTEKQMFKANKAGTAAPSAKDGTAYLQDILDRIKGLETMVKKEEGIVSECLEKLEGLDKEADEAIDDPLKIIAKVRGLQDTDEEREKNREAFEKEYKEHWDQAMKDLEKDTANKADRKKHKKEVEKDFKLAKQVYEASGKLEDARHMLLNGSEQAAFYGLGGAETKARYARKDLKKHKTDWVTNVRAFNTAVGAALDNAVQAVDKADNMELSDKGKTRVAEVRGRLTRLFDPTAFDEAITSLSAYSSDTDKTKARAIRERGLQTCRTYMDLVDNDPDIVLLDLSPAGGFAHSSALLKRTLMMLERTMLVSVPHGE